MNNFCPDCGAHRDDYHHSYCKINPGGLVTGEESCAPPVHGTYKRPICGIDTPHTHAVSAGEQR